MKTEILLWSAISVLTVGIAGNALGKVGDSNPLSKSDHAQTIKLDDGTKLTLLGVTVGTRQMAPGYENLRTANWIYTPNKPPMLWIKYENESNQPPIYEIVVYDKAKTACVSIEKSTQSYVSTGVSIQGFILNAFPRWDREFIVRVRPWPFHGEIAKGQFVVSNPVPVTTITNWTAESLPVTKSDGDLEVTLTKLVAGAPFPYRQGEHPPANDPAKQCVHLNFHFRQNGEPTTNWYPWPIETFDAYGNHARGLLYAYPTNGINPVYPYLVRVPPSSAFKSDGYFYRPGLWSDKSPWKVRLEFIRRSGFSDNEMVTFTNLPVKPGSRQEWDDEWNAWDIGRTNFPFTITPATVNGVHLKVLPPLLLTNRWQSSEMDLSIIIGADPGFNPRGMNLTVVAATDNQGRALWSFERPAWAGHYSIEFAGVHDDIKSLNLKLALCRDRFVEFTVKPEER